MVNSARKKGRKKETLTLVAQADLAADKFHGHTWEQISVGQDHICGLDMEGEVICNGQPTIDARLVPQGFVAA